jgi:hypothetical protein
VENERCSVVRKYMEHSESSGAEAQFRLQCFMSGLKVLTPKEKYNLACIRASPQEALPIRRERWRRVSL